MGPSLTPGTEGSKYAMDIQLPPVFIGKPDCQGLDPQLLTSCRHDQFLVQEQLSTAFKVQGIPSLVVLDADYNVVTLKGRDAVTADPTGAELPWYPKPVSNLEFGPGDIEEVPTFLVFCETSSDEEKKQIEETMTSVAQKFVDKQKAEDAEFPDMAFVICKSNCALGGRLRSMFGTEAEKTPAQMVIVDIPSNGAYYLGAPGPVSLESIQTFVDGYKAGSLERKQLG
eukprot:s242_g42.t1